jgi:hypothetical protein
MSAFPRFLRRHAGSVKPTVRDPAPETETVVEDRPTAPPLPLDKLVPEDVDPALLRARENLDGE